VGGSRGGPGPVARPAVRCSQRPAPGAVLRLVVLVHVVVVVIVVVLVVEVIEVVEVVVLIIVVVAVEDDQGRGDVVRVEEGVVVVIEGAGELLGGGIQRGIVVTAGGGRGLVVTFEGGDQRSESGARIRVHGWTVHRRAAQWTVETGSRGQEHHRHRHRAPGSWIRACARCGPRVPQGSGRRRSSTTGGHR